MYTQYVLTQAHRKAMSYVRVDLHVEVLVSRGQDLDCASTLLRLKQFVCAWRSNVYRPFKIQWQLWTC